MTLPPFSLTRRNFLKGLGALAALALPACRRAQEFAVEPEDCPEWLRAGEERCYATSIPWATGALPLLVICHGGLPTSLQGLPQAPQHRGLPAWAQASLLDLYDGARVPEPQFNGRPFPLRGLQGALRGWAAALREELRVAFLLPGGWSALRSAQVEALRALPSAPGARRYFFSWDPAGDARGRAFAELERLQDAAFGPACRWDLGWPQGDEALEELTALLRADALDVLMVLTPADPAAFSPAFAEALAGSHAESLRLCLRPDETSRLCGYVVPQTHFLEEWGADADAFGNLCLRQPVTMPLRPAFAEAELLEALLGEGGLPDSERRGSSPARARLEALVPNAEAALRHGMLPGAAPRPRVLPRSEKAGLYLHPFFADGRFAHNAWLRETEDALSGVAGEPVVWLPAASVDGAPASLNAGSTADPGTPREAEAAAAWFSRPRAVRVGGRLLPAAVYPGAGAVLLPLLPGLRAGMAWQQVEGKAADAWPRRALRAMLPDEALAMHERERVKGASPQWGMRVDLSACVGCQACLLACRAENNVPTVGAEELRRGRDLQWLRVDAYLDVQGRRSMFVPWACRQCEQAPCEAVCPVNATVHTAAGLSAMVYPRCWGTRYCAAACPYEARRFNFHDYAREAMREQGRPANPEVTVRSRGVMEKCSYCVQRINAAKINGGAPQAACEQACPTGAIRLIDLVKEPVERSLRCFDVAETRPRTHYLR